ncbi:MAG: hydroxymethylbilane synthase [Bacteroidota bacterium]
MRIKIGTRGSKLALWQANLVQSTLSQYGIEAELVIVSTYGDTNQVAPLYAMGATGVFTKALDEALLNDAVDIAVHSAKDMPSQLAQGLAEFAYLQREDPRDVLLATTNEVQLDNFARPLVIGTSSVRRQALMRHYFPHVTLKDIRGNVDTRIQKMEAGDYDGIILARAGVKRMGLEKYIVQKFNASSFTPAIGQGAIAVVGRAEDKRQEKIREALDHAPTHVALKAERAFLRQLNGGCSVPAFGLATVVHNQMHMVAGMFDQNSHELLRYEADAPLEEAESLGTQLADKVLTKVSS